MKKLFLALALIALMIVPASAAMSPTAPTGVLSVMVDRGVPVVLGAPAASVFIANPDVADVQVMSPTAVMVFGKKIGETTLMATDNNGNTLLHKTITVQQDLSDLRRAMDIIIPDNHIKIDAVPNGIALSGETKDAAMIEDARKLAMRYLPKDLGEVINRIRVMGSNQIQIRVRFAEVSRDVDKRFGIDWESIGNIGGFAFGLASGSNVLASFGGVNAVGNNGSSTLLNRVRPTVGSSTNNVIGFSSGGLNGMIDALAQDGFVTLLAEPNLTAMSGETASFLAGGEFPIPVPQSNNQTTIEWKKYGVSLAFTPTLVGENRINLHVRPEVSQLSNIGAVTLNNITVPALTTRRAETTIELASGQSFAIGGLLDNRQNESISKYPFIGDIPVLGALFRSTRFQNSETELVIIITPYIVKPSNDQLALPTDGFSPPSDTDRILFGRVSNSDPDARTNSGRPLGRLEPSRKEQPVPVPAAAPIEPVTSESGDSEDDAADFKPRAKTNINKPATQINVIRDEKSQTTLNGPGGFILE